MLRLAAHLGYTVRDLLDQLTSRELAEWRAFERIEGPLGGLRGDVQAGIVAAQIYNANRGKTDPVKKPAEFVPRWDKPQQQTPDQLLAAAQSMQPRLGGSLVVAERDEQNPDLEEG